MLPYAGVADANVSAPIVGSKRHTLIYLRSACSNARDRSAGMLLRHTLIHALRSSGAHDVKVGAVGAGLSLPATRATRFARLSSQAFCTCSTCGERASHAETLAELQRARFCPVLNGDTAASLRLSEVILAGCIPVFVGPPWHALALYDDVDYKSFAVFVNVSDASP